MAKSINNDFQGIIAPVSNSQRIIILDILRGFALLGICMANYPEFSLYSFLSEKAAENFPTSGLDHFTKFLLYFLIDGKFYTIFSVLFGIGFSIIINNISRKGGNGYSVFFRRMLILLIIGFAHLMIVWSGDILMLYALVGMVLPMFHNCKDKTILIWATVMLLIPVIIDLICEIKGIYLSSSIVEWQKYYCDRFGITDDNFAYWLRDSKTYHNVFQFLIQGAIVRLQEFVDGHRYFKVLGLFLIGLYIGRKKIFHLADSYKSFFKKIMSIGFFLGLPLSALYSWSAVSGKPLGNGIHSLIYFLSVYITSFGYIAAITLIYLKFKDLIFWNLFSFPGKMALTNYISQSILGMFIFYGIGFGFGASLGLFFVECVAVSVFTLEILYSLGWLSIFRFGPLEWIWRCLTYRKIFPILKSES